MNLSAGFHPPTPQQLSDYLQRHSPQASAGRQQRTILWSVVAGLFAVYLFAGENSLTLMLPWIALIGFIIYANTRARRRQMLQTDVQRVGEMAMLRQAPQAMRAAWKLLPKLTDSPQSHGQVVSIMAGLLLHLRAYDQVLLACDYLLPHVPSNHPAGHVLRVQRLLALLHTDRLADADDAMRSLRAADLGPIESGMLHIAELYQQIKTYHFDDAVAEVDHAIERLRPLSMDAAYGYALIALAYHQLEQPDAAQIWWQRATLLHTPQRLYDALPEVNQLQSLPPQPRIVTPEAPR